MMGLFNKKKEDRKSEQLSNPEYLSLVSKWDAFLQKIESRFVESLDNAHEALLDNLEESDYQLIPTLTAWSGIKAQILKLGTKIETTYDHTVKGQMLEYVEEWDILDQYIKGTNQTESMYKRIERYEIKLKGEISKRFYNHAVQFLNEDFKCSQCNAKLEVKKDIFRSHYISCMYCNTVNTFRPNDKIAQIAWVIDYIVKEEALDEWDSLQQANEDYHSLPCKAEHEDRSDLIESFKNREICEKTYWSKIFNLRSTYLPEYTDSIEHDIATKMKHLYLERKREYNF